MTVFFKEQRGRAIKKYQFNLLYSLFLFTFFLKKNIEANVEQNKLK